MFCHGFYLQSHAISTKRPMLLLAGLNALLACNGGDTGGYSSNTGDTRIGGSVNSGGTGGISSRRGGGTDAQALGGNALSAATSNPVGGSLFTGGGASAAAGMQNNSFQASGGTRSTGENTTGIGGTRADSGDPTATGGKTSSGGAQTSSGGLFVAGGSEGSGGKRTTAGGTIAAGGTKAGSSGVTSAGRSFTTGGNTSVAGASSSGAGDAKPSSGCGKTPTLKNSPSSTNFTQNGLTISGKNRQYIIRWPERYDNNHAYRLIIGLHGATGKGADIAGNYFGLWDLAKESTIFIAPSADGGLWSATTDLLFVDEILKAAEADLCIDTTRILLEGFSQGAAMSWTLACSRPGVFRAAVGHSGGGVANPTTCQPIAYFGSLGLQENGGQDTQTDQFAKWDGCTIETLPKASTGGHVCSDYKSCSAGHPVRWCPYDGGHTPSPTDSGQKASWMPAEVWAFLSQF